MTKSFEIMTFQGILLFLLFPDTFRIQGILSFLLFQDTFGKGWKVGRLESWKVKEIGFVISPSHNPRPSRAPHPIVVRIQLHTPRLAPAALGSVWAFDFGKGQNQNPTSPPLSLSLIHI